MKPEYREKIERLLEEIVQYDEEMTPGKWEVATSNSFRRISRVFDGKSYADGCVLHATTEGKNQYSDLAGDNCDRDLSCIVAIRNRLPEIVAALRDLLDEPTPAMSCCLEPHT